MCDFAPTAQRRGVRLAHLCRCQWRLAIARGKETSHRLGSTCVARPAPFTQRRLCQWRLAIACGKETSHRLVSTCVDRPDPSRLYGRLRARPTLAVNVAAASGPLARTRPGLTERRSLVLFGQVHRFAEEAGQWADEVDFVPASDLGSGFADVVELLAGIFGPAGL